jgi:Tol biopolymer transport system component
VRLRAAALVGSLLLVPLAKSATPAARIAFTQANGNGTVAAVYDADATNGAPVVLGDSPSWSPDGTQLAVVYRAQISDPADIAVVDAGGTLIRRLTTDSGQVTNTSPEWSPRGDEIAFFKSTNGIPQVWLISPAGTGARAMTSNPDQKFSLQWSPDGSHLLWTSNGQIVVADADGSNVHGLLSSDAAFARDPAWSPDGTRIAYTNGPLIVMNADGSNRHAITQIQAASPSWSPDASRIVFVGTRPFPQFSSRFGPGARADISSVGADGSDLQRLTGPPTDEGYYGYPAGQFPTWWPDGSRIFFQDNRGGDVNTPVTVHEMNSDGTCEGKFAPNAPVLRNPTWRPGSTPGLGRIRCVDLRIVQNPAYDAAAIGKPVPLAFRIDNDGDQIATRASISLTPMSAQSLLSDATGCGGAVSSCTLPNIAPHTSVDVSVDVRGYDPNTNIGVKATVTSSELDSDPSTNSAQSGVTVLPCTIVGTYGNDYLNGTDGPDKVCGRPGADHIYGRAGDDYIDAGAGNDVIYPGPGHDTVLGKGGADIVYARDGQRDWIDCGTEHDIAIVDKLDHVHHCEVVVRPR